MHPFHGSRFDGDIALWLMDRPDDDLVGTLLAITPLPDSLKALDVIRRKGLDYVFSLNDEK